ncbi:hypothetical protein N7517_011196 [Penicillium concentricum]|uniref:DUF4604 domain-containing protein n=1 Tax=Penicillium concentricum TaxID=293559 RepID=A0A9W9RAF4_9EURO|nr:uncharacterized protein N7517_011196 [Penicillium concentricum]KAJ5356587.1 hypothetical protein N7517_011196 [Penicillium concentricum]
MAKNPKFEYDAKQPAFLQKLRGQYGDNSGRLERPALRPTRLKVKDDDDDDEPTYLDEESNEVISKEEYKALVGESGPKEQGEASNSKDNSTDQDKSQTDLPTGKQNNLTEVGGQRKRKQAKVVGEDNAEAEEVQPKATTKKSKKPKKIKLSFDEE